MSTGKVMLAHGSGGRLMHDLIRDVFERHLRNPLLSTHDDAASWVPELGRGERLALTTDSYVVQPVFFPGGDIGRLAVCGTVNDLAMVGARPLYLTAAFILEEGFALDDLDRIVTSMAQAAKEAGVHIVAGDTKVVDHGSADGVFVTTAGIGVVGQGVTISGANARPGDSVLVSGALGVHGMAILSQREGLRFSFPLASDCAPLNGLVAAMLAADERIHCLRDPTRGGVATTLCELAQQSQVGIEIDEAALPIPTSVHAACELLGLDPLYVANEGKLVAVVAREAEGALIAAMKRHELGHEAAIIGRVTSVHPSRVVLQTRLGTHRIVDMLTGAQLPRIC
jgi:hydrogenase expression/formation protein HypE